MSFKDLKKNRQDTFSKILENTGELVNNGYSTDPDDWYPSIDKAGNGSVKLRFLPPVSDDDLSFVRWFSHEFKDPNTNKWYIENCRTTLSPKDLNKGFIDPVADFNKKLWDSVPSSISKDEAKKHPNRIQATRQSRKQNYRANIYIISDGVNPENNGKVKKFRFGKWAFDCIRGLMIPSELEVKEGAEPVNPFDIFDGPIFNIKIFSEVKDGKSQRNYSRSNFDKNTGPLLPTEKEMERVYDSITGWSLKSYVSEDKFKSYEELKKRLDEVVGFDTALWTPNNRTKDVDRPVEANKHIEVVKETVIEEDLSVPFEEDKNEDDDFFANLTEE